MQLDRSLEALDYAKPRSELLPLDWTTTHLDYTRLVRPRSDWTEVVLLTGHCLSTKRNLLEIP
jgi:hypothetical protein